MTQSVNTFVKQRNTFSLAITSLNFSTFSSDFFPQKFQNSCDFSNNLVYTHGSQKDDSQKFLSKHYTPKILKISSEELKKRAAEADASYKHCVTCGNQCNVDRTVTENKSKCNTGMFANVFKYFNQKFNEKSISGNNGSGSIQFSNCNIECDFCIVPDIAITKKSTKKLGETKDEELANMILDLQNNQNCHNINFISSSHVIAPIIRAVAIAKEKGLKIPLIYTSGGYDSVEGIKLLDKIIDVYICDMKFGDNQNAFKYCGAKNYVEMNQASLKEMHRQVGDLKFDSNKLVTQGLLIRHLIMPSDASGYKKCANFLSQQISKDTFINISGQYQPKYRAHYHDEINKHVTYEEYNKVHEYFKQVGLHRFEQMEENVQGFMFEGCNDQTQN